MNWKNIRSLFIVDEEGGKKPKEEKDPPAKGKKQDKGSGEKEGEGNVIVRESAKPPSRPTPPPQDSAALEKIRQQFFQSLYKALEENNLEGVDYLEFRNTLKSFAKMPMDEHLKFQTALTAVETMGGTKDVVLQSAEHYLGVLAKDKDKFTAAVERHRHERVEGELKRIEQLKARQQEKAKMIQQLTQEMEEINTSIAKISGQVEQDKARIDNRSRIYLETYETVAEQIRQDIGRIKSAK